ncbi:MBL fold metallo-hydrolase [Caproicibacterium sp. BJN0003]|uniref:MBL fold metallo-hydrolase n=1 Tax=Caproicibacterium sp. BJN0003 TaxID=2994078 RepID=UPI0022585334|nr:MBL fold metallo-hydrolase [Caproicibacterium sp. BJN0003]UZT82497.1 hypothetical protein OP489_01425 [Caproicibacterium sp. BJN0003]
MEWLEMHNVEYGECIVLGGHHNDLLMVDCGSTNRKIREGETDFRSYVDPALLNRYDGFSNRAFLLTHYHRDHLCGMREILDKRPGWFSTCYLPCTPADENGKALLLDFSLIAYAFMTRRTGYGQVNTAAVKIFFQTMRALLGGKLYALGEGDRFLFDDVEYEVLWPKRRGFIFEEAFQEISEELNVMLASPFLPDCVRDFVDLKEDFCKAYLEMCGHAPVREADVAHTMAILNRIDDLIPILQKQPVALDICEYLEKPLVREAYSEQINAAGIIFQNVRKHQATCDDILMTGDAPAEVIDFISDFLYSDYYILKAPHHGMESGWSTHFLELNPAHILISNGESPAGGKISPKYAELSGVKHCTNCSACAWYQTTGCSCNRVSTCYDQERPGLALRCPGNQKGFSGERHLPCGIYVIGPSTLRGCLCD